MKTTVIKTTIFKTLAKSVMLTVSAVSVLASGSIFAQGNAIPRTPDGKPDLNGIWQTLGTAHWDLETHASRPGPVVEMPVVETPAAG